VDYFLGDGICDITLGSGICTLRAAIMEANSNTTADTIYLPSGIYHLTIIGADEDNCETGDLDITDSLTIFGDQAGSSIIDAEGLGDRVIQIFNTADSASISWIQIQHGDTNSSGGGIFSQAPLTITHTTVYHNSANVGGGIITNNILNLTDSKISDNAAVIGGGLAVLGVGVNDEIDNSLIINNSATGSSGGIANLSFLKIENSYIGHNTSPIGAGLVNDNGSITLDNVIFEENYATDHAGGIANTGGGIINGHNVSFNLNGAVNKGGAIHNYLGNIQLNRALFSGNSVSAGVGGAIINEFDCLFILIDSTINNNTASNYGGGFYNGGTATIRGVTLSANHSQYGGGIANMGTTYLENSTISDNQSYLSGAGIYNMGTFHSFNATITANLASSTLPSGVGGGVLNGPGSSFNFRNTILYGNHHTDVSDIDDDCAGTLTTQHSNLIGTLVGCNLTPDQDFDYIGIDPLLGALANNGGFSKTHALLPGSPAIDIANNHGCVDQMGILLTYDQRGHPRHWDGDGNGSARCDIGAFEYPMSIIFLPIMQK
jgi:hypothetical protein